MAPGPGTSKESKKLLGDDGNSSPTPPEPSESTNATTNPNVLGDKKHNEKVKAAKVVAKTAGVGSGIAGVGSGTPGTTKEAEQKAMFHAARGRVQRVIDVALLVSNMSRISTILRRKGVYETYQVWMLCIALVLSIIAQIIAGVCFFITIERDAYKKKVKTPADYTAFTCVAFVMILNIFISTFDATWGVEVVGPIVLPGLANMTHFLEG